METEVYCDCDPGFERADKTTPGLLPTCVKIEEKSSKSSFVLLISLGVGIPFLLIICGCVVFFWWISRVQVTKMEKIKADVDEYIGTYDVV